MKKFLALTLSLAMISSFSVCAYANEPYGKWEKDTDTDLYFKVGDYAYSYDNFIDVKQDSKTLIPGNEYYFEMTWQGRPMTDEFFEHYTSAVEIGTAYPSDEYTKEERKNEERYLSSTSAQNLVDKAELSKVNDRYYLHLAMKNYFPYTNEKTFKVLIFAKDKQDTTYRSRVDIEFDVGYDKNNSAVMVSSSECTVDNNEPIMEFSSDIGSCVINMDDGSTFEVEFSKNKDTKVNLHHSLDENLAVKMANPKANMRFLSFTARPYFTNKGRLMLKASDKMQYAYEIGENGTLKKVGAEPFENRISVITDRLTSYVVSDVALNQPGSAAAPNDPAISENSAASAPTAAGKVPYNPGTGANL